jgi:type VI secretion system protein ImpM
MPEPVVNLIDPKQAAGWYGKLPGLGDFAMRRLPAGFVSRWDDWLQRGLLLMREASGPSRGDDAAAPAPVRRFWIGAGVVDPLAWAGLLMHSTDRAGRRFPLTVAQPMPTLAQSLAARQWLSSVVAAMRFTLDNQHTLDDFEECLSALPPPATVTSGRPASRADEALAAAVLRTFEGRGAHSIWWCHGAVAAQDFLVFEGLPPPAALACLLECPR